MNLDIVIVTKLDHYYTLRLAIPRLLRFIKGIRNIIIISKKQNEKFFKGINNKIRFIDENKVLPNFTIRDIESLNLPYFPQRAGWYFQQILKLGASNIKYISDNYIVWDADTIPLKNIEVVDQNGKYNFIKSTEHHLPYFKNYEILLGEKPNREFSFISQFMIFNRQILREMFNQIEQNFSNEKAWYRLIFEKIEGEHSSLFSEYETYGHYIKNHYPELCNFIELNWLRNGTEHIASPFPKIKHLDSLAKHNYYASFELRPNKIHTKIIAKMVIIIYPQLTLLKLWKLLKS